MGNLWPVTEPAAPADFTRDLVRWSETLAAIARTGLGFTQSLYERERYEEVLHVAGDIKAAADEALEVRRGQRREQKLGIEVARLVPGGAERLEQILVEAPDVSPLPVAARVRRVGGRKIAGISRVAPEQSQRAPMPPHFAALPKRPDGLTSSTRRNSA